MSDLILFDIDGTLFDPEKFGRFIRAEFTRILNVGEADLIRTNADYYAKLEDSTDFNPRDITSYIALKYNTDPAILDKVFWENDTIYKDSFYEDAESTLSKLSQNHTLGIFSQGNAELQNRKIASSGFSKYLSPEYFYIYPRKLGEEIILALPKGATVIDNNHDVILKIAASTDAIWINRKTEDSDPNVRTIHNLKELIENN